ncbi:uncharacterized protein C9orf85 homolog [Branchiostoma lanceolatum]|uniref:uncharacterized protein C9orf85 homolog n=1 Tax=Branchiostoma lanceolatum TaxID=7740 RepID=UPI0034564834
MSSQRGNVGRSRPQKYKNSMAFRNNLHDQSQKTKKLNAMVVGGLCAHCKSVIDWKIKYKKYKPLSQPKKCVKCEQKTVKQAYTMMCMPCARTADVCAKCGKGEEVVTPALTPAEEAARDAELQQELKFMSERQRRTFMRKGGDIDGMPSSVGNTEDSEDDNSNDSEDEKLLEKPDNVSDKESVVKDSKSTENTQSEDIGQQNNLGEKEDMAAGIDNAAEKCEQLSI